MFEEAGVVRPFSQFVTRGQANGTDHAIPPALVLFAPAVRHRLSAPWRTGPILALLGLLFALWPPWADYATAHSASPFRGHALPTQAILDGYPQLYQQHALTCEAASVSMATGGAISEARIMASMPLNPDPWRGFRGNLDRPETLANGLADYGIYAPPLAQEMQGFGFQTTVISGTVAPDLLRYSIGVLHLPLVVWVTYGLVNDPAITGHDGSEHFTLVLGEPARLAVGYDAGGVYTHDPIDGERYDSWFTFLRAWRKFNDMALVLAPHLPRPATPTIQARRSAHAVVWSWPAPHWPTVDEAIIYRAGLPLQRLLLVPGLPITATTGMEAAGPPGLAQVRASPGIRLTTLPLRSTATILPVEGLLHAPRPTAPRTALTLHLEPTVPYSVTVRALDPLGLASLPSAGPPAVAFPPPVAPVLRAAIAGPSTVRWSWPVHRGLTYTVVS